MITNKKRTKLESHTNQIGYKLLFKHCYVSFVISSTSITFNSFNNSRFNTKPHNVWIWTFRLRNNSYNCLIFLTMDECIPSTRLKKFPFQRNLCSFKSEPKGPATWLPVLQYHGIQTKDSRIPYPVCTCIQHNFLIFRCRYKPVKQ